MTATREHLAGLELAHKTIAPYSSWCADQLRKLIEQAKSAHEPVQGEDFCDSHCTWLDHQPGCPMHEPVQAEAVHAGFDKTLLRLREATQVHSRGRGSDMATVIKRDLADLLNDYDRIGASYRDQHNRIMAAAKPDAELVEAVKFAAKSLAQVTSSDGSGHADIALGVLHMAGFSKSEREALVDVWKSQTQWRIDAKLAELQK